jgi:hypothetical protein
VAAFKSGGIYKSNKGAQSTRTFGGISKWRHLKVAAFESEIRVLKAHAPLAAFQNGGI